MDNLRDIGRRKQQIKRRVEDIDEEIKNLNAPIRTTNKKDTKSPTYLKWRADNDKYEADKKNLKKEKYDLKVENDELKETEKKIKEYGEEQKIKANVAKKTLEKIDLIKAGDIKKIIEQLKYNDAKTRKDVILKLFKEIREQLLKTDELKQPSTKAGNPRDADTIRKNTVLHDSYKYNTLLFLREVDNVFDEIDKDEIINLQKLASIEEMTQIAEKAGVDVGKIESVRKEFLASLTDTVDNNNLFELKDTVIKQEDKERIHDKIVSNIEDFPMDAPSVKPSQVGMRTSQDLQGEIKKNINFKKYTFEPTKIKYESFSLIPREQKLKLINKVRGI